MKLIHLTDTHFVPAGEHLYGHDPRAALETAIADINAHHGDAELAVLTGDLTHWGEPQAFESLAETLAALKPPLRLLIGNHDDRQTFRKHFPDQAVDEKGFVQSVVDVSAGRLILLDTVLAGTHAGHFCAERQAWLADCLMRSEGRDIFLFMHHPPFPVGIPASDRIGLLDSEPFRAIVEPHKANIRHLFFGHLHRPIAGSWLGIPVSTVRAMNHQVWLDMNASTLRGSFEPPAYAVALIDADSVVVHFHDFMDASPKFDMHDSPWDDWSRRHAHP